MKLHPCTRKPRYFLVTVDENDQQVKEKEFGSLVGATAYAIKALRGYVDNYTTLRISVVLWFLDCDDIYKAYARLTNE